MRGALALALVAVLSGSAAADPQEEAKAHIDAGTRFFNVQQYDKAEQEYQQAYLLDPKPEYLYAIAQAQRLGGDCVKALRSYNAFLRTQPADPSKAQANIERCEQYLKEHPPVDPTPVNPNPNPDPSPTPPPVAEAKPPPKMVSEPWTNDWIGHALVGGGLLIAGGGAFLYLDARGTIQDHNNATTYEAYAASASDADKAKSRQTMGVAAMAVAGGVILGGVLHYVFHTRPYAESAVTESAVTTTATVTRDGATFAITGTF